MNGHKKIDICLKVLTSLLLGVTLVLTFTISDYYIFNKIGEFNLIFVLSQWIKKGGILYIAVCVFYNKRHLASTIKYILPIFVLLSFVTYGSFFNITKVAQTPAEEIYNSINLFMPKAANMALFFIQGALILAICLLFFLNDGFYFKAKSLVHVLSAIAICTPLNIFENFFDINEIPSTSFLRFYSFTIWHLLAFVLLFVALYLCFLFLRYKDRQQQNAYLGALAIALLIQYHSKDSMVMGDGYNVYHTVLACIPLFICNLGMYVTAASIFFKRKWLYSVSFFIHAAGALSVFVYFGKDDLSNYGIFCSYSVLYFCMTHCLLFILSVMPTMLNMYKFSFKDCPSCLIYYFIVIVLASIASALITSASMTWHTASGYYLTADEILYPNYSFTQINPFPFEVPQIFTITIWKCQINVLYILALYIAYIAIFYAFIGLYYLTLYIRKQSQQIREKLIG
jgi:hypothetical protein